MSYDFPKYEDHSLKGYLRRQHTGTLLFHLDNTKSIQNPSDYDLEHAELLKEVLRERGIDPEQKSWVY